MESTKQKETQLKQEMNIEEKKEDFHLLLDLPKELWQFHISSFLSRKELSILRLTCHWFKDQIIQYPIWKQWIPFKELENFHKSQQHQEEIQFFHKNRCISDSSQAICTHPSLSNPNFIIYGLKISFFDDISNIEIFQRLIPTTLKVLDLSYCKAVNLGHLNHLPTNLTELNFEECQIITNQFLANLPPSLKKLNLSWCKFINRGLKFLPNTLIKLNLSFCSKLRSCHLSLLPSSLRALNLAGCSEIGELQTLPPQLRKLNLKNCNITDQSITCFPSTLTELNLEGCMMTTKGVVHLPTSLKFLDLPLSKEITDIGIEFLFHHFPNLTFQFSQFGNKLSPLYWACDRGYENLVSIILSKQTKPEDSVSLATGKSPLYIASQNGHYEIVSMLIASGAAINKPRNNGATPLFSSCQENRYEVAKLLLENGADPNISRKDDGCTCLIAAIQKGFIHIIQLLLQSGADVNKPNLREETPLEVAQMKGVTQIVQIIQSIKIETK